MTRRIIAYILIIAVTAVNYGRFFAYAGYELNKSYIAAKLCENRDKPWLHCNGRCYFMKKVKQAEEKQNNAEKEAQKNLFQEACFTLQTAPVFASPLLQVVNTPYKSSQPQTCTATILQPPQIS